MKNMMQIMDEIIRCKYHANREHGQGAALSSRFRTRRAALEWVLG